MSVKRFYVQDNGKVIDVGFRPSLLRLGLAYNLKVVCRNLPRENKVEVIVKGVDEDVETFWKYVKKHDVRPVKEKKLYTVSKLEPYEGVEPDWSYHTSASIMNQIVKGVQSIEGMSQNMKGMGRSMDGMSQNIEGMSQGIRAIDSKLGVAMEKFGMFGTYMKEMGEKLDALPERIADALAGKKRENPKPKNTR